MPSLVYTNTRGKLSKKQRLAREALLKEQRAIKSSIRPPTGKLESFGPVCSRPTGERIASRGTGVGNATLTERPVYTGDNMIGIGQLHKSNAVPIFRAEDALDLAHMRR